MSSKKDNFNSLDKKYMRFAFNLAMNQKGLTGTNPSVGCVIVKNNKIVSFGHTSHNGRPHAEINALNKNMNKNFGSNVYITLEPCTHYGQTAPCTNRLIKSKVKKVFYAMDDLDVRTKNKAKKILNSKKILVKNGLLNNQIKKLYKSYIYIKKNNLPYIIGKIACSANNFILKKNKFITNVHSQKVSHILRFENQGILSSYKTINNDNPKLNCRLNGLENFSPTKIVLDRDLKINLNSYIVNNSRKFKTYIFHNSKKLKKIKKLKKKGLKLLFFEVENDKYFNLEKIFKKIYDLGIHTLLVECGKDLTQKILSKRLFNEFYLFKSNKNLKVKNKLSISNICKNINEKFTNKKLINTYLDKDKLIQYY